MVTWLSKPICVSDKNLAQMVEYCLKTVVELINDPQSNPEPGDDLALCSVMFKNRLKLLPYNTAALTWEQ